MPSLPDRLPWPRNDTHRLIPGQLYKVRLAFGVYDRIQWTVGHKTVLHKTDIVLLINVDTAGIYQFLDQHGKIVYTSCHLHTFPFDYYLELVSPNAGLV
jgi:hypothetical protein